jgi:hypothetical protein
MPAAPLVRSACPMRVPSVARLRAGGGAGTSLCGGSIRILDPDADRARDGEQVIVQLIHMRENETVRRTFVHLELTIRK